MAKTKIVKIYSFNLNLLALHFMGHDSQHERLRSYDVHWKFDIKCVGVQVYVSAAVKCFLRLYCDVKNTKMLIDLKF